MVSIKHYRYLLNRKLGGAQSVSRTQEYTKVSYPEKKSNHFSFVFQPAPSRYGHCCWGSDITTEQQLVDSSWNVMAHGAAREGNWRGNWRMEWVASTHHTTSEHGVSSITTADAHTSTVSSRLNWRPRRFKWTRPFRRKKNSGFCACAITFQLASTTDWYCGNVTALAQDSLAVLARSRRRLKNGR